MFGALPFAAIAYAGLFGLQGTAVVVDGGSPVEYLATVVAASSVPTENASAPAFDARVPLEAVGSTQTQPGGIPAHYGTLPYAAISYAALLAPQGITVNVDGAMPNEWSALARRDGAAPDEATAAARIASVIPTEYTGTAATIFDSLVPLEFTAHSTFSLVVPTNFVTAVSFDAVFAGETLVGARGDGTAPTEALARPSVAAIVPSEARASTSFAASAPLEALATARGDGTVPSEASSTAVGAVLVPSEFVASASLLAVVPSEALSSVAAFAYDGVLPLEWLRARRLDGYAPVDIVAAVSFRYSVPSEFRSAFVPLIPDKKYMLIADASGYVVKAPAWRYILKD